MTENKLASTSLNMSCTQLVHNPSGYNSTLESIGNHDQPGFRSFGLKIRSSSARRTSTDSMESIASSFGPLPVTNGSNRISFCSSLSSGTFSPRLPNCSNPSYDDPLSGWLIDEAYHNNGLGGSLKTHSRFSTVWKPSRPATLPLPQNEPERANLSIIETPTSFEIRIHLPDFSPDAFTVAQRRSDNSIYIVADQVDGPNTGHFERLISLVGQEHSTDEEEEEGTGSRPSKEVTSRFDCIESHLLVVVVKACAITGALRQRAVVCDNGSGLTGNKTYRLFL